MGKILTTVDEIQGRLGMTQEEAAKSYRRLWKHILWQFLSTICR